MFDAYSTLQYFNFEHLPESLQQVSKPFHDLAYNLVSSMGNFDNPQLDLCLIDLLRAKDCAVRAQLYQVSLRDGFMHAHLAKIKDIELDAEAEVSNAPVDKNRPSHD